MEEIAITSVCLLILCAGVACGAWWLLHRPACAYASRIGDAIADAQDAVRDTLEDPGSAQFRHVRFHACSRVAYGEVNTRNRSGDYIGFRSFTVLADGEVRIERLEARAAARPARPVLHLRDS